MKLLYTLLFLASVLIQISGQICSPILDEVSRISNEYRQSSTYALSSLNFDWSGGPDPFFDGDGIIKLFDLGFSKGIWAGGFDPNGNLKLAASGYGNSGVDFTSGPIWEGFQNDVELCEFFRRVWTINASDIASLRSLFNDGELELGDIPMDILEWPANGNPHIKAFTIQEELAPYFDNNQDGRYDPLMGDYPIALVENPDFIPSQFRFYVFNDQTVHGESRATPLDMEFHVLDYVVDCLEQKESESSVFTRLKYINRGVEDLRDFRIGIWDDEDLGCFENDYAGCSPSLDASFTYNADGIDLIECADGLEPVPMNYGVVKSKVFLNRKLESSMYFFNSFGMGGQYYSFLDGRWPDGTPLTFGGDGNNPGSMEFTSHAFSDLPNQPSGWSMQEEFLQGLDIRNVSVFGVEDVVLPSQSGSVDFADHILLSQSHTGLDVFELYESRILALRTEYTAMIEGDFNCEMLSATGDLETLSNFTLHPNPAMDYIVLDFNEAQLGGEIFIHSTNAMEVESYTIYAQTNLKLSVTHLEAGIYMITLRSAVGLLFSQRFVKL